MIVEILADFQAPKATAPSDDQPGPSAPPAVPVRKTALSTAPPPKAAPPPASKPSSKPGGPSKTLTTSPSEPVKYRYSSEDAAAKAVDLIPASYHTRLADGAWKVRLEAAEEMIKWVEEEGGDQVDSEVLFRFLGKTPGWGEKNFQVSPKSWRRWVGWELTDGHV